MTGTTAPVPPGLPAASDGSPSAHRFAARICLVTGAASGIGRSTAMRFAAEGATVVAVDMELEGAQETLALAGLGERGVALQVDVRSVASVAAMATAIDRKFGGLDVVINNAGIEVLGDVLETEPEMWDEVMAVNLRGVFLVSRACLPMLLRRAEEAGRAAIVNNASLMGQISSRRLAAYCASKAGVISLTRSMALDYAESGLRVNCVCPGIVHTPMLERRFALADSRSGSYQAAANRPPVKYIGRPEDVAAAIAYLASDEARFVTGIPLTIDGGVSTE